MDKVIALLRKVTRLILLPIITTIKKLLGGTKSMPRTIYNEGRVVGYSAYEIYVRHARSEGMEPVSEKEWLAASLTDGSSLLLKLSPTMLDRDGNALSTAGSHIIDIPLPTEPSVYELTTREPNDWSTRYTSYYTRSGTDPNYVYTQITTEPVPTWEQYKYYSTTAPTWVEDKYYKREGTAYVLTTSEPSDWSTHWMWYFETDDMGQTYHGVVPDYVLSQSQPIDWATDWKNYYTRSGASPDYIYKQATSWKPDTYYRTVVTHVVAANTIVASLFLGSGAYENGSCWASHVGNYGQLLDNNAPLSSETYKDAEDVDTYPTFNFSYEAERIFAYSNIVDGVVITSGKWKPNSTTPPGNDFIPDLSDSAEQQIVRLYLHCPLTTSIDILLSGFMLKSVLEIMADTEDGSIDTMNPEDGDFLGPAVFPWGNKIIFSAPSSLIDFVYKRKLTQDGTTPSDFTTVTNKSIIDTDMNSVYNYYYSYYPTAGYAIPSNGVSATTDVPYNVLTVFNRNSILPPALYISRITQSGDNNVTAEPVDTVAPGTVKIFTDSNKKNEAAAVSQISGNVGMYRDGDYIIHQTVGSGPSDPSDPISDNNIIQLSSDRPEGQSPFAVEHTSGKKTALAISLQDTQGQELDRKGDGGSISPGPSLSEYRLLTEQPDDWTTNYSKYFTHEGLTYPNVVGTHYRLMTEPPANWTTNWSNYYTRGGTPPNYIYDLLTSEPIPTWQENTYYEAEAPTWQPNTYYTYVGTAYVLQTSEPADWSERWMWYFEQYWVYWSSSPRYRGVTPAYSLTEFRPVDWGVNWSNYFVRSYDSPDTPYTYVTTGWHDNTYYEYVDDLVAPTWEQGLYYTRDEEYLGTLHWNDLLCALANNKSINLFDNAYFQSQFVPGIGIAISNSAEGGRHISAIPPAYQSAKNYEDFRFNVVNNFSGYVNGQRSHDEDTASQGGNNDNSAIDRAESTYTYRCDLKYAKSNLSNDVVYIQVSPANSYNASVPPISDFQLINEEPADWATDYTSYYTRALAPDGISYNYTPVPTGSGAPTWQTDTYYTLSKDIAATANCKLGTPSFLYQVYGDITGNFFSRNSTYVLTVFPISDWNTQYDNFYTYDSADKEYIKVAKQSTPPAWQPNTYYARCNIITTSATATSSIDVKNAFAFLHTNSAKRYRRKSNILNIKFTDEFISKIFGANYVLTTHQPNNWDSSLSIFCAFSRTTSQPSGWLNPNSLEYYANYYIKSPYGGYSRVYGEPPTWQANTYYQKESLIGGLPWESNQYYVDVRQLYKFTDTSERLTGIWNIFPRKYRASWEAACGLRANKNSYYGGSVWVDTDFAIGRGRNDDNSYPNAAYINTTSHTLNTSTTYDISVCGFSYCDGYNQQITRYNPTTEDEYPNSNQINIVATGVFVKVVDP